MLMYTVDFKMKSHNDFQVLFDRLYSASSNCDGGTLLQIRNMLNRRNVATNPDGRFNASIDFIELVTESHMLAAGMHFFGLKDTTALPTFNCLPLNISSMKKEIQWRILSHKIGYLIDQYVIVQRFSDLCPQSTVPRPLPEQILTALEKNPHAARIAYEHAYLKTPVLKKRRKLPQWLNSVSALPCASQAVTVVAPDKLFDYACAVLNDGLLLLEFRDAIHEGDGERILRCWKFFLLYFYSSHHTKYCIEAFSFLAKVNGAVSQRIKQQILWSRVINSTGGRGKNIPIDLHMEHLNRSLKDIVNGLGANICESSVINASKLLNEVLLLCERVDNQLGIQKSSIHHTRKSSDEDRALVLKQLTTESQVFHYTPGRKLNHKEFNSINPHIARTVDANALFKWINMHKKKLAKQKKFPNLFCSST